MSTYLTLGGKSLAELPEIPTNLVVIDGESINLSWTNNVVNVTGTTTNQVQYWDTSTSTWIDDVEVAATGTTTSTTGITVVGSYNIRVCVKTDTGRLYPSRVGIGEITPAPPAGATVKWLFNDNILDTSGNGYDLDLTGTPSPAYTAGKIGESIYATATPSASWLSNSDAGLLSVLNGTNSYSVCVWFKIPISTNIRIGYLYDGYPKNGFRLYVNQTTQSYFDRAGNNQNFTATFNTNTWHQLIWVFNGTNTKIYIDNDEKLSYDESTSITATQFILSHYTTNNIGFDNTYIYPRALNSTDLNALWNGGAGI